MRTLIVPVALLVACVCGLSADVNTPLLLQKPLAQLAAEEVWRSSRFPLTAGFQR